MPVHPASRRYLVVRHPGTGRLVWAPRLPFGYIDSPHLFCGLMESIADKMRAKAAGRGIHFYVFVDDWLCVGDTYDLTVEGCSMLEDEFRARGISWAPHKHRGPAACMEFLGLLLANVDGDLSISLTRKRRDSLLGQIREWRSWGIAERAAGRGRPPLPGRSPLSCGSSCLPPRSCGMVAPSCSPCYPLSRAMWSTGDEAPSLSRAAPLIASRCVTASRMISTGGLRTSRSGTACPGWSSHQTMLF